jgi:parallel beta-helix repeat protein
MRSAMLVAAVCLVPVTASARDVPVSTADELIAAIANAQPGDVILVAAGTYALTGASCTVDGTEADPIVVRAATPLAARIDFDGLEGFRVTGAHWHFEGLDVHGACAVDDDCEHAFHVSGGAVGFVLRGSRVVDFNAQLKVNAAMIDGAWVTPDRGVIEDNELFDTRARNTGNPVTKLNIDTGDDWVVRANDLHDFEKGGGDGVSYGVFLKSGGHRGLIEKNLVRCSTGAGAGTRIGLSLGGGGTAPQFCAPAFDPNVPCSVEHTDGMIRNNIVIGCSDVGIYLNRAANATILHNTLIATSGIDFRFDTTTGQAVGNLLAGAIRMRDGGTFVADANLEGTDFAFYADAVAGDLTPTGDISALVAQSPPRVDISDDYCGQLRPIAEPSTIGAIEHPVGTCDVLGGGAPQPDAGPGGGGDDDVVGDDDGGGGGGGCGCGASNPGAGALLLLALFWRRSPRCARSRRPATPGRSSPSSTPRARRKPRR